MLDTAERKENTTNALVEKEETLFHLLQMIFLLNILLSASVYPVLNVITDWVSLCRLVIQHLPNLAPTLPGHLQVLI